jgi:hypothetical protein
MISSEVQRTLVKSPPELWAELSDPAALARHLGELGEIHIVRTEPERVVEWAAEHTTGVVSIKPSGWGTRVTLSATREQATEPEPLGTTLEEPAAEAEVGAEPGPGETTAESQTTAAESQTTAAEPEMIAELESAAEPQPATEPEVSAEPDTPAEPEPEPAPRRGFFARLFRRRSRLQLSPETAIQDPLAPEPETSAATTAATAATSTQTLVVEPSAERPDAFAAVRQVLAPETFAATHPFAAQAAAGTPRTRIEDASAGDDEAEPQASPPREEPSVDIAAELMAAEDVTADEVSAAEVTAVLTAVLDRLGAAHHRPFSRG